MEEDKFTFGKTVEVKIGDKEFKAEPKEITIDKNLDRQHKIEEENGLFDNLLEKAISKEEEMIKEAIKRRFSEAEVEFIEDMIEEEEYEVVRTWFDKHDCYIEIEPRHFCFVKKLYLQDALAEVWVV